MAAEFAAKVAATLAPQSSPAGSVTLTPDNSTSLAAITAASDGGKQQLALERETSVPQHPPGASQHLPTDDWLKRQTLLSSSSSVIIEPPSSAQWQQGSGSVLADERTDSSQPPSVVTVHTGSVTVSDAPASIPAFSSPPASVATLSSVVDSQPADCVATSVPATSVPVSVPAAVQESSEECNSSEQLPPAGPDSTSSQLGSSVAAAVSDAVGERSSTGSFSCRQSLRSVTIGYNVTEISVSFHCLLCDFRQKPHWDHFTPSPHCQYRG